MTALLFTKASITSTVPPLSGEDFKMADTKQHAFKSPELQWLNNYLGSSDTLKRNTFLQNLLGISVNQDNENRNLVAQGSSSKPSSHLSHGGSPPGKGTNKQRGLLVGVMNTTFKIATATALAPIERVNIMMQCQNEMIKAGRLSTPYKGMNDCLLRTIKHEGVISLWRGNSMNVIAICVREALLSAMYYLPNRSYFDTKIKESPLWVLPFVMPLMLYHYPLNYARVRLATDVKADARSKFSLDLSTNNIGKRQFSGVIDIYKKTLQLDGIHGLYRGFSVSCIGLFAHYTTKKSLEHTFSKEKQNQKKSARLALIITGCIMFIRPVVFYPFVTVSRRMMMTSGEANKYQGARDAFYQIVKTEGVSSLFKGLTPFMIHRIAKNLVMFGLTYTTFLSLQKPAK